MKKLRKRLAGIFLLCLTFLVSCSEEQMTQSLADEDKKTNDLSSYTISKEDARNDLEKLLNDIDVPTTRSFNSHKRVITEAFTIKVNASVTRSSNESTNVHVFNFKDNEGYAIMSGDKRIPSLIALSYSGNINQTDEVSNPGLSIFAERMEDLLTDSLNIKNTRASNDQVEYGEWENIVYKQDGYCPVKWGQRDPYNRECPLDQNGKRTPTGCVATAVAQLMSVYQYPTHYDSFQIKWNRLLMYPKPNYSSKLPGQQILSVAAVLFHVNQKS